MTPTEEKDTRAEAQAREKAGVASAKQNERLEHSVTGATTRDDAHDVGVPMLPGDPSEPQGPEDALGEGKKRGDYRDRVRTDPHAGEPVEGGGEPVLDDDGNLVDVSPSSRVVPQLPRTEQIGDEAGEKGGVTTSA